MTTQIWRRRPDVLARRSLDAVILLPVNSDDLLTLAATGPEIWELLAEPRSLEALVTVLAAMHDAPPDVVAVDVEPVLRALVETGAVEVFVSESGDQRP